MSPENPSEVQHLLTVPQAAAQLQISRRTLERLIVERKFRYTVRIGRSVRILQSDIQDFITRQRSVPQTG
jgi:excisionase family DNA binding protein